jgi:integrase
MPASFNVGRCERSGWLVGMRAGETATLKVSDVVDGDGKVWKKILLSAAQKQRDRSQNGSAECTSDSRIG